MTPLLCSPMHCAENLTFLVPELCPKTRIMLLEPFTILTVEIKDDGFGQSLRAVIVVARTCKFSVAMLSVETFNFHGISRLSRDNFFETTIDQLTILPPADTASWTSFEKKNGTLRKEESFEKKMVHSGNKVHQIPKILRYFFGNKLNC